METMKKLLVGGLCLLLGAVVYAGLSSVRTDLRQAEFDSLAHLYISAAPYALITPVKLHVRTAATTFRESDGTSTLESGILRGVLLLAQRFPGWKDFGALPAHLRFVKQHHQKIEKIAVVSDGGAAIVMPHIAQHFIHAQVKHFEPAQESAARDWLIEDNRAQIRTAA